MTSDTSTSRNDWGLVIDVVSMVALLMILAIAVSLAGCATQQDLLLESLAIPHDDTAQVQAAATAHTCLPAGDYYVMTPPAPRHDYIILGGAVGCDPQNPAVIHQAGDGGTRYWAGFAPRTGDHIDNVVIDDTMLTNVDPKGKNGNFEQTHAIHLYGGINDVTISNVTINHPIGGDCVNVVGLAPPGTPNGGPPNVGLTVQDVTFTRCQRGCVQISRGADEVLLIGNKHLDCGFDIGSESAGGFVGGMTACPVGVTDCPVTQTVTNVFVEDNYFTSPRAGGYSVQAEWWNHVEIDNNVSDVRPWELYGTDNASLDHNVITTEFTTVEALVVGDRGWNVSLNDNYISGPYGSLAVRQLGRGRPSDLGELTVDRGEYIGDVTLRGVTGATLTDVYHVGAINQPCGLNAAGACVEQTTGVVIQ